MRPNSDYALNLALIHEVLKREAYDQAFVARYVSGMDALRQAVDQARQLVDIKKVPAIVGGIIGALRAEFGLVGESEPALAKAS